MNQADVIMILFRPVCNLDKPRAWEILPTKSDLNFNHDSSVESQNRRWILQRSEFLKYSLVKMLHLLFKECLKSEKLYHLSRVATTGVIDRVSIGSRDASIPGKVIWTSILKYFHDYRSKLDYCIADYNCNWFVWQNCSFWKELPEMSIDKYWRMKGGKGVEARAMYFLAK